MRKYFISFFFLVLFCDVIVAQDVVQKTIGSKSASKSMSKNKKWFGLSYGNDVFGVGSFSSSYNPSKFNSLVMKYRVRSLDRVTSVYASGGFEGVSRDRESYNHIKVSSGGDLTIGRDFYFVLGVGLFVKAIVSNSESSNKFKDLSMGIKFNSGLGYQLNKKVLIDFLWHYQLGLTPLYTSSVKSQGGRLLGVSSYEDKREWQLFLQVGLYYSLGRR